MTDTALQTLTDRDALRTLASEYARGADRRDPDIWTRVLSDDCVVEGPGFECTGIEACLALLGQLEALYAVTRHNVLNQTAIITGDTATGETYCMAEHITRESGEREILTWHIRYQDEWRRADAGWQFTRRNLIRDWQETRALAGGPG